MAHYLLMLKPELGTPVHLYKIVFMGSWLIL